MLYVHLRSLVLKYNLLLDRTHVHSSISLIVTTVVVTSAYLHCHLSDHCASDIDTVAPSRCSKLLLHSVIFVLK
ncbi:hypothetical protein K474DRAFT_793914 [Panus rudis PR-1116 ss-1]|nr:hypothetical protein K474DRAFT_793914 [Panus rudis PR-1116 ss-1]